MNDAVIGKEVDGYRIQAVLGRGGMGTVYRAEDVNLSRTVALKRINPSQSDRESFIHRFRSEAQALARIDSPHIVGVYALRETDIGLLIVMEYVEGGTLKEPLDEQGALAPVQAVPILEQILKAFHDAHSAGVIHRDIKPQNIMLTRDGMVKVTDFGIAKLRRPDSGETETQGGQGGTLKYMSPEQISNISAVDARSDLYSIGMTAYEMLAGCLPFKESDTDFDIMRKVVEGEIPPPDDFNPDIPSGLAQWVVGAIQKAQDERYQSAEEMLDALRKADRQIDATQTQPEWEVDDGSVDVDETQTVVPGDSGRTRTVMPEEDEDDDTEAVDPGGETVLGETPLDGGKETQPPVSDSEGRPPEKQVEPAESDATAAQVEQETEDTEGTNWAVMGGAAVAVLLLAIAGYVLFRQMGREAEARASLGITTMPSGVPVLVNGDTAGTTPVKGYAFEAGAVQLEVLRKGRSAWDTSFTAKEGDRITLSNIRLTSASSGDERSEGTDSHDQSTDASAESSAEGDRQTADASRTNDPSPSESQPEQSTENRPATAETGSDSAPPSESATGTVALTVKPVGTVLVGGEKRTGTGSVELSPGEHTVTCRHPQRGVAKTTVQVAEGQTQTLTCYTEHLVNVTTRGPFARIWLNGEDTGRNTNATQPLSLPPGSHQIEVRRRSLPNFQINGGRVKITRGGNSNYSSFTGTSYRVQVKPTFEKVEYAIVFEVSSDEGEG